MNELEFVTLHRRHLHQYPELSLHEFETTSYITSFLEDLGVPYDRPLKTGVIAYLEGNSHHTIAFRADIDALPIYEENDIDFKVKMITSCTRVVMMDIRQHLCFLLKGVKHCMTNLNYLIM